MTDPNDAHAVGKAAFTRIDQSTAEDWAVIAAHDADYLAGLADSVLDTLARLGEGAGGGNRKKGGREEAGFQHGVRPFRFSGSGDR